MERVTHLTVTGPVAAGKNTITVIPFPLVNGYVAQSFPVPAGAKAMATLEAQGDTLLIVSSGANVAAYDRTGKERGSVPVAERSLNPESTRRLVAGTRLMLVSRGDKGAETTIQVIAVKDGSLVSPACGDCKVQTDASIRELSKQLRIGPWLNPEGRIERFLTDGELSTVVFPRLKDGREWDSWSAVPIDGAKVLDLKSAGAGLPIMLERDVAMIVPQPQTVERWRTQR